MLVEYGTVTSGGFHGSLSVGVPVSFTRVSFFSEEHSPGSPHPTQLTIADVIDLASSSKICFASLVDTQLTLS